MSNVTAIAVGVVMLVVGLVLRFYGGATEVGPFELRTVGGAVAIIGGVEIVAAVAYAFFPGRTKKLD